MSFQNENNDDITTDACPSPPREKQNSCKSSDESENADNTETQYEDEIPANPRQSFYKNAKPRGFTKVKRTSPATAYASIINITNSKEVHVGARITYNLNNKTEVRKKVTVQKTEAINSLFMNQNPLTRDNILFVSKHMDGSWQDVARTLNYSEGQIQQFNINHRHYGIKEVIYQFLLDWMQNEPSKAIVGTLAKVLWDNNQKDIVKRWSEA